MTEIAKQAKLLLGCYRTGEANDPAVYSGAVIAALSDYPLDVVREVVDPRRGLPSKSKWLPTVFEIKEACEAVMAPRRREADRLAREEERKRTLPPPVDRTNRPTYAELRDRCHAVGLMIGDRKKPVAGVSPAKIQAKYNISPEAWNTIPDAKVSGNAR